MADGGAPLQGRRMTTTRPAAAAALDNPVCCGRPMSSISVTDEATELAMVSCSSCSRHAWLQDGALLDREGMLAALKQRIAEAPKPKGGRPKGSGKKQQAAAAVVPAPRADAAADRARDMRAMLSGFRVHGS